MFASVLQGGNQTSGYFNYYFILNKDETQKDVNFNYGTNLATLSARLSILTDGSTQIKCVAYTFLNGTTFYELSPLWNAVLF